MSSTAAPKTITELKVSAHLMTLDTGLFCVFNSPGAPSPDAMTGLPGVRLSMAPAPAGLHGDVSISGFNAGGWLSGADGAALVRVTGGPAQVLVTVYQDLDGQRDAPKLQVIRLTEAASEGVAAPAIQLVESPEDAGTPTAEGRSIEVAAHIYGRGDVGGVLGDWMGDRGSKRWIEGFGLMPGDGIAVSDIEYQAVLGRDWQSPWSEGGQFCGSRGMSLPLLGMRIRLRGAAAKTHTLAISATFVDGTEVGPVTDGEACEAASLSPLEAFKVTLSPMKKIQRGGAVASASTKPPARSLGRAAAEVAPAKKSFQPKAPPPSEKAMPAKATAKPGRKTTSTVAAPPPAPATPSKPPAKRTPATTRRR